MILIIIKCPVNESGTLCNLQKESHMLHRRSSTGHEQTWKTLLFLLAAAIPWSYKYQRKDKVTMAYKFATTLQLKSE